MRVLVLGGTGSIGAPVVRELISRGHHVIGLARSGASARMLREMSATPLAGDIAVPEPWLAKLGAVDAMAHLACDFSSDMGAIDQVLLDRLLPYLARLPGRPRLIYTGGCLRPKTRRGGRTAGRLGRRDRGRARRVTAGKGDKSAVARNLGGRRLGEHTVQCLGRRN